ncbi:MAG: glycoside hydrolase family 36 protein [Bryobacteraceae bacterium]
MSINRMPSGATRRAFLQTVPLAGLASPALPQLAATAPHRHGPPPVQVESTHYRLGFDVETGTFNVWRKDGSSFLIDACVRAVTPGGWRATSERGYKRSTESRNIADTFGNGRQVIAHCTDSLGKLDFEVRITAYDGRDLLVIEALCHNPSRTEPLLVQSLEPVRAVWTEGGACNWPDVTKLLTNGYMYYDPGRVEDFYFISRRATESVWNMGFFRDDQQPGLVIGFLENQVAEGKIAVSRQYGSGDWDKTFALTAEAFYNREFLIPPGGSVSSGRVAFQIATDIFTALESYAQAIGELHRIRLNPIVTGWCNWFFTNEFVHEDEIVRNAEFVGRHLRPFGMEYIQLDDGYQRAFGDWEANENFPHGMKWLAGKIHDAGLKAGIWLAPYCITDGTEVQRTHPDWLIKDSAGEPKICGGQQAAEDVGGYGFWSFHKKIYGLDITHPGAAEWHRKLFEKVASDWNYDFVKIDFVEWTLLAAGRYHDPKFGRAGAYRRGFQIIRDAIGPNRHLLDCGPPNTTVGILDSVRIEQDMPHLTWPQYVKTSKSSAPAAAKRYYFHKRAWINDADHLGLALLTMSQAKAAASIIALSGGTLISGDRLYQLDPERLEILKRVLPIYGEAARPLDLFDKDFPEIFALPIRKENGGWLIVGYFNYDEGATVIRDLNLTRLGLDPQKTYLAYEFWSQQFLGEVSRAIRLPFEPSSVQLLAFREKLGVPQVLGTDRHFTQGALELENVRWDAAARTLSGAALGTLSSSWKMSIHVPDGWLWDEKGRELFHDSGAVSAVMPEPNLIKVHLAFTASQRVNWSLRFKRA